MPKLTKSIYNLITTEKTTRIKDGQNKYTFLTNRSLSVAKAKKEIEEAFKVDVENVHAIIMPGRKKRIGRTNNYTRLPASKKVVVKLKAGQKIDIDKKVPTASEKKEDAKND